MSNKKLGNKFENELAQYLFNKGFWVLRIIDGYAGQPVDIIAVKKQKPYLIECKVCTKDKFTMKRLEPNQHSTFQMWEEVGNGDGFIALKLTEDVYLITYKQLCGLNKKVINKNEIIQNGIRLEEWINNENNSK